VTTLAGPIIACEDLWKVYDGRGKKGGDSSSGEIVALKEVTLRVDEGECFVIMGLSGSGKLTLVRCLTGLIEPSRGRVVVDGFDIVAASERELAEVRRKTMGMVFQNFALLPHLTVLDNVAFPLAVRGIERTERQATARGLIATVGLAGREGHYPSELSGGQQQRVGIARALSCDPKILFMDEPFSALDPLLRRELQNEFIKLRAKLKKTIVFITHDFDEAIRFADRIAIMRDGAILEIGTPEELIVHSRQPYVMEFTRHVDHTGVLRARTIAQPVSGGTQPSLCVDAESLLYQFAREVLSSNEPIGVVSGGRLLGILRKEDVISVLTASEPGAGQ
jgi:glycine betaine/proline transport system ATP-binding protein